MKHVLKKLKCKKQDQVRSTVKNTSFCLYILRRIHRRNLKNYALFVLMMTLIVLALSIKFLTNHFLRTI